MKNPVIEAKVAVQKKLWEEAGSIEKYLENAHKRVLELEKEYGIKFKRGTPYQPDTQPEPNPPLTVAEE